jgi:reverse gyrase
MTDNAPDHEGTRMRSPVSPRTPYGTDTAVQAIEDRYRLLAENTNDVVWTMSLDGAITYISLPADSFHAGIAMLTANTSVTASKPRGTQTSWARRAASVAVGPPSPLGMSASTPLV